ncbi:MAG: hypothetical protein M1814_005028 [Vezdaea aestivalis]|nr:MAG: hypothetical protein M1814_005028 [Vezdaea aestivalis]
MSAEKRQASNSLSSRQIVKRPKSDNKPKNGSSVAVVGHSAQNGALIQSVSRTSSLPAPIMELTGHSGEVFATRFDPTGQKIASGSMDRSILLWRTFDGCENFGVLRGHKSAVLDLQWSRDSSLLYSCSADSTVASWDLETGLRIRRHEGHEEIVNCIELSKRGKELIISGSDDGTIGIWDPRRKAAVDFIETSFPITAVALAEAGNELYSGGIDNEIKVWDMRKKATVYFMKGHTDTVTSLSLSPDAQSLLSKSMDSTVKTWDVRPFAPKDRHLRTYDGATVGIEKNVVRASWSATGDKVTTGTGDGSIVIWETRTGKMSYKLPGHKGCVNDVRFWPGAEPIVVSGSSDRTLILGELGH